jgi:hypothetical protein
MTTKTKQERLAELEAKKDPYNWDRILNNLDIIEGEFAGEKFLGTYLGDLLHLNPSGKLYAFWTTNQTKRDVELDQAFWQRMERFAEKKGFGITYINDGVYLFQIGWEPEEEDDEEEGE